MPPFFRFSFIIHSEGYLHGKEKTQTAHGVLFTFGEPSEGRKAQLKSETWSLFEERKEVGNEKVTTGTELEEVTASESRGIGFFRPHFLVNDRFHHKGDYR